jgi:predicted DNA-binding transcriptional regulator AlpA
MGSKTNNTAEKPAAVERLTYRIRDIAQALGVSLRTVEGLRSAGTLPKPDILLGRVPLWRVETIRVWLARGKC